MERLNGMKKSLKEIIELENNKKPDSLFDKLFNKGYEKIDTSNMEDAINKMIQRNQASNRLRADVLVLQGDVDSILQNKIKYKKNESAKKLYEDIKDSFDRSCKEMYRQFKIMIEGGDQNDLRKSIFSMKKSIMNSSTLTIDLSKRKSNASSSSNTLNSEGKIKFQK